MGAAVTVTRGELTPAQLRAAAGRCEEPDQVRRLLAIALVLEDVPRRQAAEQCGMDRQTLSDRLAGQAGSHGVLVRTMALRMPSRRRMQAMMATFLGRPRATRAS